MSEAISVENLSKIYRLGEIGTGTLSRDLHRWFNKVRGKEDPFLKIGESNDRTQKGTSDIVYSLRDISFEIEKGDTVGIIGRNGAGKSTLLKILSRVTSPTTGSIHIRGRVASLLEVGTGFHPELTGRENIYLNGAILGMRKKEISRKLDQIIDFSGVERYIDTPVKRYSSGMYVRLAFAVATHLESEILIVDEVLAVGDTEFQQKCLGKMGEVSQAEGRTILFVSHNMAAITKLCKHSILLRNGLIEFSGNVGEGVMKYISSSRQLTGFADLVNEKHHKCKFSRLNFVALLDSDGNSCGTFFIGLSMTIRVSFELFESIDNLEIAVLVNSNQGIALSGYVSTWENLTTKFKKGKHIVECSIPFLQTLPGRYSITLWTKRVGEWIDDQVEHAIEFEVLSRGINTSNPYFEKYSRVFGLYQPSEWKVCNFEIKKE